MISKIRRIGSGNRKTPAAGFWAGPTEPPPVSPLPDQLCPRTLRLPGHAYKAMDYHE